MATYVGIPSNLLVYKPKQQYTALCWQINVSSTTNLNLLDFEVEVDVVDTFDSINKKTYTKNNVEEYQNGKFYKSFVIKDPTLVNADQTYYFRVKVSGTRYTSYWSDVQANDVLEYLQTLAYNTPTKILNTNAETEEYITFVKNYEGNYVLDGEVYTLEEFTDTLTNLYGITDTFYVYIGACQFDIKQATWYTDTETAENLLPDNYVYTKIGETNVKKIIEMYMRLIGTLKKEAVQVANNYNYSKIQDEDLYDRLGVLLTYTRNTEEPIITYKYELLALWQAYLHQGTFEAFTILIKALYGTTPTITILKDVRNTWHVYEQVPLLTLDGSTATITSDFDAGTSFYDPQLNKIVTATQPNTWKNAVVSNPDPTATYQLYDTEEMLPYHYDGDNFTMLEGRPELDRFYVREGYYNEETEKEAFTVKEGNIPYAYTKQYLAHNMVININNPFGVDIDQDILLGILNNLKPLNMGIIAINVNSYVSRSWGSGLHYGQHGIYWGGTSTISYDEQPAPDDGSDTPTVLDTDCTIEILNFQDAVILINNIQQDQYRGKYGETVTWSVSKAGYTAQSGTVKLSKATVLTITLEPSTVISYLLYINAIPTSATVTINGVQANELVLAEGTEYTYTVELEGYVTQSGSGTLTQNTTIEVNMYDNPQYYTLTITSTPEDATVLINGENTNTATLAYGSIYNYSISAPRYDTATGTGTITKDTNLNITLQPTAYKIVQSINGATPTLEYDSIDLDNTFLQKEKISYGGYGSYLMIVNNRLYYTDTEIATEDGTFYTDWTSVNGGTAVREGKLYLILSKNGTTTALLMDDTHTYRIGATNTGHEAFAYGITTDNELYRIKYSAYSAGVMTVESVTYIASNVTAVIGDAWPVGPNQYYTYGIALFISNGALYGEICTSTSTYAVSTTRIGTASNWVSLSGYHTISCFYPLAINSAGQLYGLKELSISLLDNGSTGWTKAYGTCYGNNGMALAIKNGDLYVIYTDLNASSFNIQLIDSGGWTDIGGAAVSLSAISRYQGYGIKNDKLYIVDRGYTDTVWTVTMVDDTYKYLEVYGTNRGYAIVQNK